MEFAILYILLGMCGLVYMTNNYTTKETVLHENVLFVKDWGMSLSSSRWIMTFILDINVYEEFILKLNKEINDAASLGEKILGIMTSQNQKVTCQYSRLLEGKLSLYSMSVWK